MRWVCCTSTEKAPSPETSTPVPPTALPLTSHVVTELAKIGLTSGTTIPFEPDVDIPSNAFSMAEHFPPRRRPQRKQSGSTRRTPNLTKVASAPCSPAAVTEPYDRYHSMPVSAKNCIKACIIAFQKSWC